MLFCSRQTDCHFVFPKRWAEVVYCSDYLLRKFHGYPLGGHSETQLTFRLWSLRTTHQLPLSLSLCVCTLPLLLHSFLFLDFLLMQRVAPLFLPTPQSQSERVTKAPSPRQRTPGCTYSRSLQALRAASGFRAHFTRVCSVLDVALQESAITRTSSNLDLCCGHSVRLGWQQTWDAARETHKGGRTSMHRRGSVLHKPRVERSSTATNI